MKKICIILTLLLLFFSSCKKESDNLNFDNNSDISNVITKRYHKEVLDQIQPQTTLRNLTNEFDIECVRRTERTSYIIFLSDEGERYFVFLQDDGVISDVVSFASFKSRADFDWIRVGETSLKDIGQFDNSLINYPISSAVYTGHILQDGLVIIEYDYVIDNELLPSPVVSEILFFEDSDYESLKSSENAIVSLTPYILTLDRCHSFM